MVSILHISDLHIIDGADWNNMERALLKEVREKVGDKKKGEKLLVITGDLHNFNDENYQKVETFLRKLITAMDIEPKEDIFVVPGNHDVANPKVMQACFNGNDDWEQKQESAVNGLLKGDFQYIRWRLEAFVPYCAFLRELQIYSQAVDTLPAQVHIRTWRGKLNFFHLNTALVADGKEKQTQLIDIASATHDDTWNEHFLAGRPTIALGHHSFFDIDEQQQRQLKPIFLEKNVKAYLCGDVHKREKYFNHMIELEGGFNQELEIPNVICMKTSADKFDDYSEFGFYWHLWDEETNDVTLEARCWKRDEDQTKFIKIDQIGSYCMVNEKKERSMVIETEIIKKKYFDYLSRELGVIQFEGMPTDKDTGTVKADLEKIFVPLEFRCIKDTAKKKVKEDKIYSIDNILTSNNCSAILAKPGGGKSTLLRRIALAYADAQRKQLVEDNLPDKEWFPVYIRCRDLGENIQKSIIEIIGSIIIRAELLEYKTEFETLIREQLKTGEILLLVDGLDEVSNEQSRIKFVEQLHTFLGTYPKVHLLMTSRETGFRAVAQKVNDYCNQYVIADLNNKGILRLSENWHRALIDNPSQAKKDSDEVCKIVLQDFRITALARNPLLLTTLLFVKRWIGYLPTKKCQLYQEMIKLLLVSWNAAAHHRMDMEETEPQLAYIAYEMTKKGKQTILKDELIQCINAARKALPELLGYTKISPTEFINQVEARSSVLIQQGLEQDENGKLVQSYEFSHLSFQEYLTAKAISENWVSEKGNLDSNSIYLHVLKNYWNKGQWWEVIPLAAVLMKRQAKNGMEYLLKEATKTEILKSRKNLTTTQRRSNVMAFHLANCIASEVLLNEELLDAALVAISIRSYEIMHINSGRYSDMINGSRRIGTDVFKVIYHSQKYGERLKMVAERTLLQEKSSLNIPGLASVWLKIYNESSDKNDLKPIVGFLESGERKSRILGALLMMDWAFHRNSLKNNIPPKGSEGLLDRIFCVIKKMIDKADIVERHIATWCVAWSGYNEANIISQQFKQEIFDILIKLWCVVEEEKELFRVISWAICTMSEINLKVVKSDELAKAISGKMGVFDKDSTEASAIIYLQYFIGDKTANEVIKFEKNSKPLYKESSFIESLKEIL